MSFNPNPLTAINAALLDLIKKRKNYIGNPIAVAPIIFKGINTYTNYTIPRYGDCLQEIKIEGSIISALVLYILDSETDRVITIIQAKQIMPNRFIFDREINLLNPYYIHKLKILKHEQAKTNYSALNITFNYILLDTEQRRALFTNPPY
jgi:hypothetical protein